MELEFLDLALIIKAEGLELPSGVQDEALFLSVKSDLIRYLNDFGTEIVYFGIAPDNTADNQDELLHDGTLVRIICNEKYLGIDSDSQINEVFAAFLRLIETYDPFWTTIIVEKGFIKTETTLELLYRDVF